MKYILDASVALKWVLPEVDSDKAIAIQEQFENGTCNLLAPDTFLVEVAHALTRAERKGTIQPPEGMQRFSCISICCPLLHSYLPLLPRAFELSSLMRLRVYDCLYIALAEREQCELITADVKLVKNFPSSQIIALSSL